MSPGTCTYIYLRPKKLKVKKKIERESRFSLTSGMLPTDNAHAGEGAGILPLSYIITKGMVFREFSFYRLERMNGIH